MGHIVVMDDGTQQGDGIATTDGGGICEVPPQLATQSLKMTIG